MPFEDVRATLTDIIDAIGRIRRFTSGLDVMAFSKDDMRVYATTYALMIISEASRRLPGSLKDRYPEIPWRAIAGAGNAYRHDYQNIAPDLIWRTATTGLDALRAAVSTELDRLDDPQE